MCDSPFGAFTTVRFGDTDGRVLQPAEFQPKLMNSRLTVILLLFIHAACTFAVQDGSARARFDEEGRFNVDVVIPAGSRHAVLEITTNPSGESSWRRMIATAIDGRSAHLIFRLPPQPAGRLFARVRASAETTLPPVELTDPALVTVTYFDGIDEQTKITFLSQAAVKMREWAVLSRAQYQANLIAWALANANVADARIATLTDNVSIRFKDGDICVLLNPQRSSGDTQTPPQPVQLHEAAVRPSLKMAAAQPVIGSLPESNTAVCAFSLESYKFANSAPTIAGWLNSETYTATNYSSTTVDEIKSWSSDGNPLGVLFWQVHGCAYAKPDGSEGIALVTRQFASTDLSFGAYKDMRQSGELLLAIDDKQTVPFYTVTSAFVRKYMKFAPHSVVVLDACCAAAPELANAFIDAGAGSYASWNWLSGDFSSTPCLKVFDRLLGKNEEPPISTPKERPFGLQAIRWWMTNMGYDIDPSPKYPEQTWPNARLTWFHHGQTPANILKPGIMRMIQEAANTAEPFTKLLIEGDFGTDPGVSKRKVYWGGVEIPVLRWHPTEGILIRLPQVPPTGNLEVHLQKSYYLTKSNVVPVTEWAIPFTFDVSSNGSLKSKMEITVKFRGDIHGSRGMPEMDPQYLSTHFVNAGDSTGSISASGVYYPSSNSWTTWTGGSSLTSQDPGLVSDGSTNRLIFSHGTIQPLTGLIQPFSVTATADFTATDFFRYDDGRITSTERPEGSGFDIYAWLIAEPMRFNPATGVITGRSRTIPTGEGSVTLSWPNVTPQAFPSPQTLR